MDILVYDEGKWTPSTLAEAGCSATGHTHSYLPLGGGIMTGNITLPTVSSTAGILKGHIGGLNLQSNRGGDMGILGTFNGGSTFGFQLYGYNGGYGFLTHAWGSWDIKKIISGNMYLNNNLTYYLNPPSNSHFNTISVAGTATFDGEILGTAITLNVGSPLRFTSQGTGTYNRTVMYHGQNSTSGNDINGVMWEMGRLTDSSSAEIRKFAIGDRGGGIHWIVDGTGNTIQDGGATFGGMVGAGTTPSFPIHAYASSGSTAVRAQIGSAYIDLYPHSGWNHILGNAPKFYFDKEIRVDTGLIGSYNEDLQLRTAGTTRLTLSTSTGSAVFTGSVTTTKSTTMTPRWDNAFYVLQSQHWYGHDGSQGMYLGESGNTIYIRGTILGYKDITAYYSDSRLKDFHGVIENPLDKVMKLNGYYWTENEKAKELGYNNDRMQVGVSAQEIEKVLPELIKDAPIGHGYKTIDYGKITPLLIEAIKELKNEINQLKGINNG